MKTFILFAISALLMLLSKAQDSKQLHETAKAFMRQGDYANASLVLNRALQQDPSNLEIIKDLAMDYYFEKEYTKGLEVLKPIINKNDADDQCYQIAGTIDKALGEFKEADKIYSKGIKKFPGSGSLYSEYGELLLALGNNGLAIKTWEKGIEHDPEYPGNYYNASRFYYAVSDKIWSILYGEIFLNIEPGTTRTSEIKNLMLEGYKRLFADADLLKGTKGKSKFETAFLQIMNKQSPLAASGITPESLTMIRTRFVIEWFQLYDAKFPFRLFQFQRQLSQEGIFDAYNQWIFSVQNLPAYENWIKLHQDEYNNLIKYQKNRVFKMPKGQHYK